MLASESHWIWDSWIADDGEDYHLFYLQVPRSLGDAVPVALDEDGTLAACGPRNL